MFFFTKPATFSLQLIPLITKAWSVHMIFQPQLLITGLLQCCVTSVGASCQHFNGSWCLQLQHHAIQKNYWKQQDPLKRWQLLAIPHELILQLHHCANVRSHTLWSVSRSFASTFNKIIAGGLWPTILPWTCLNCSSFKNWRDLLHLCFFSGTHYRISPDKWDHSVDFIFHRHRLLQPNILVKALLMEYNFITQSSFMDDKNIKTANLLTYSGN